MSVKSGQSVTVIFTTRHPASGAPTDADATPSGILYVNGSADSATITVTNITTGRYKAAVTLPTLDPGDVVSLLIAATVASAAGEERVWEAVADTKRTSDLNDIAAGAAMTLTTAERTAVKDAVEAGDAMVALVGRNNPLTAADTRTALGMAAADLDDQLDGIAGADFGDDTCTLTIRTTDGSTVITDAQVYIGDDATPTNRTRTKTTDSLGQVKFDLTNATTYYLWVLSDAFDGTNPTAFVAAAD